MTDQADGEAPSPATPGGMTRRAFAEAVRDILARELHAYFRRDVEDPDGRWTPEALMLRRLVRASVPTVLWMGEWEGRAVVWMHRGARTARWAVREAAVPAAVMTQLNSQTFRVAFPSGPLLVAWQQVSPDTRLGPPAVDWPAPPLSSAFRVECAQAVEDWRNRLAAAYAVIGRRPLAIRIPEAPPEPDPAIALGAQTTDDGPRPLTFADLVDEVQRCAPLTCVPDAVAFVLERCLRLFLLAYQAWDLFTVADHYAGLALEASLRWLFWHAVTYPACVQWRDHTGAVRQEVFVRAPDPGWVRQSPYLPQPGGPPWRLWVNNQPLDLRKPRLLAWARRHQWLGPEDVREARHLLRMRDVFSHPAGPEVQWIGWVAQDVAASAALINAMWSRWAHPTLVPWDGAFWTRPRWAAR